MTEPTIQILFSWKSVMPDLRQYKQNATILEPVAQMVGIDVPLAIEYVKNSANIITAQLSAGAIESPILTPLGMRWCISQLEDVFDGSDLLPQVETDEDWDESLPKAKAPSQDNHGEDWGDDADFTASEDKKEEVWKDTEEDWDG